MLHPADVHLLSEARARGERYRAEALEHARVADGRAGHHASGFRVALAGALARLARLLAAVAEDLDPRIGRPGWQPRA